MTRREFTKETKREALRRAQGHCEGRGGVYGLNAGERCNMPLAYGVEFDHAIADSIGGEPTLENCICACIRCHSFKSRHYDIPRAAKAKRQADKQNGIHGPKRAWPSRKFGERYRPNVRDIHGDLKGVSE